MNVICLKKIIYLFVKKMVCKMLRCKADEFLFMGFCENSKLNPVFEEI